MTEEKEAAAAVQVVETEKDNQQQQQQQEKDADLKPWEQHSAVILIPRYDYNAPSSFLHRSHSGFLITCPIKREKSATKEAISILQEYVGHMCNNGFEGLEPCGTNSAAKKRKISVEETATENVENSERNEDDHRSEISGQVTEGVTSAFSGKRETVKNSLHLSLVKLTRNGLLLFAFPSNNFRQVVDTLSNIFTSLRCGNLKKPLWCHRILPIQETCILMEEDLQTIVSKLVQEYLGNKPEKLESHIKFAVGYNRRGIEESEMKIMKTSVDDSTGLALLDRDKCFKVVAGAFKDVAKNAIVDLKSPEVAVLVELLPLSVARQQSPIVGVSILPQDLISIKPRLCVKPLVSDTKAANRIK